MAQRRTESPVFDGDLGEMYALFLENLLFTILTLGIYRFWATTRVRRYLIGHLALMGDRLEYTGTGWELFRGFLLVFVFILAPVGGLYVFALLQYGPEIAGLLPLLLLPVFVILSPYAQFTGLRYRLSRTQWRGVRFGLTGSPWGYVGKSIATFLAQAGTLGLLTPQATLARERYRLDRLMFGDLRGRLDARWKEAPFWSWVAVLLAGVAIYGAIIAAAVISGAADAFGDAAPTAPAQMVAVMGAFYGAILIGVLLLVLPAIWHFSRFFRFLCARWAFGADRERAPHLLPVPRFWPYFRLVVGNLLITVFTLTLGTPFVWRRNMRFIARFQIANAPALEAAAQNALDRPESGEGLLDALDIGVV